jgi:hypothetical protein
MAQQHLNIGLVPNDGLGDPLRDGGDKIEDNFNELYPAVALNTAKVTNANHSGDATGAAALTLATVNASPGTYTNAQLTVNGKGLVTAAASGTAATSTMKYSGTVNLGAGVVTPKTLTGVTTEPYSIMLIDATGHCFSPEAFDGYITVGADYILSMYSVAAITLTIKVLY